MKIVTMDTPKKLLKINPIKLKIIATTIVGVAKYP